MNGGIPMKRMLMIIVAALAVFACGPKDGRVGGSAPPAVDTLDATNDFYDNVPAQTLPPAGLTVDGEVADPGPVDLSGLPVRSVIVKEARLDDDGSNRFVGAYRYDGYSLFDILNRVKVRKKNEREFSPVVDLFVEVANDEGEKVVFSWGEIFYPNDLHKILIASSVMRIVPTKSKDLWPLPDASKIVAGRDLLTERNISRPTRLTVRSLDASFPAAPAGAAPEGVRGVKVVDHAGAERPLTIPPDAKLQTYQTVFYGRGRGIHSTTPFTGQLLKDVLAPWCPQTRDAIRRDVFTVAALDGYRIAMTYAEVFNRNDQQEFLLVDLPGGDEGGGFRIFPACDFFSDRSIKSVSEIRTESR